MNGSSLSPGVRSTRSARRNEDDTSTPSDVQERSNMDRPQAASYARVSSEQQAEANTVASQIAASMPVWLRMDWLFRRNVNSSTRAIVARP